MSLLRWSVALPASERLPDAERTERVVGIVRQHLDLVNRMARRLGVTSRDLEDVVQEVMLVVVRRLEAIDPSKERAFVAATTARVTANWRRQRRRRPEEPSDELELLHSLHGSQLTGTARAQGEQGVERARKLELLSAALASMTEPQREAFILFELEQLTAREIAEQLQVQPAEDRAPGPQTSEEEASLLARRVVPAGTRVFDSWFPDIGAPGWRVVVVQSKAAIEVGPGGSPAPVDAATLAWEFFQRAVPGYVGAAGP